ncbi:hypothetical protein [uncultured Methanobacterium sp.]|uniref:hypothetical protein n=1 Tax=uncultured Methanobacterium sp. TaxID=176306 RepID=UPI002AA69049|nr:hypothetical protein [uncultured Methanobacterium sp.]
MKRSVKFCPNCGSPNIKWLNPQMWSTWKCWDCGYQGAVVIEDEKLAEEIQKKFLEKIENEEADLKKDKKDSNLEE